mmetsp:Transcript_38710/g.46882  ORF Transcript_38710/g.46882 Transcript_38710/m.46882 type:complete len:110 (+) Transcript_38710:106-435(+)|eukprot:CAMPEP_0197846890 /NCGR_PEP_ID=MMETSP1438-20131217/4701_1 /TAXON_ID=1461541 /ORGANISM="Pterosperma sp., Strain CCMP1384" /LENGTH=109 /DNA_ID=CAMNT_0043458675 /DNA_START=106 /DNA_END=435 /DNA_ORIENTATION=-
MSALKSIMYADRTSPKIYHASSAASAVLLPAGLATDSYKIIDVALGIALPIHSHIACNYVISDYLKPRAINTVARAGLIGLTGVTLAGMLKLNLQGPGLTESVKQLWRA